MRRGEGEATFTADGQEWHLRFDFNAMADFEIATGKNAMAALAAMNAVTGSARANPLMLINEQPKISLAINS